MSSPSPLQRSYFPPDSDVRLFSWQFCYFASSYSETSTKSGLFSLRLFFHENVFTWFSSGLSFSSYFATLQVPIVKLIHQQCQIEADLSLYNVLARENTCLLSLYSGDISYITILLQAPTCLLLFIQESDHGTLCFCFQILTLEFGLSVTWSSSLQRSDTLSLPLLPTYLAEEKKIKCFGFQIIVLGLSWMITFVFQVCDIGDASRGSLSSYAYILMMIFYLQVKMKWWKCYAQIICWSYYESSWWSKKRLWCKYDDIQT